MYKSNKGISLITLVITIVVIIILASITLFSGMNTPNSASLGKFVSEFSDFTLAAKNAYMEKFQDGAVKNEIKTDAHIYYELATGRDESPNAVDIVENLGDVYPNKLSGNEYYLIEKDSNIDGWDKDKIYFEADEKHYITDEGEVFILPGYLEENNGVQRWWINENKYYIGEKKIAKVPQPSFYADSSGAGIMCVLKEDEMKYVSYKDETVVSMVLREEKGSIQVPIPVGFEYVLGTGETGTVVKKGGSEFVWIPVDNVDDMFESGMYELSDSVGVSTTKYGTGFQSTNTPGKGGNREPDVIAGMDSRTSYLKLAGFEGDNAYKEFAKSMVEEFEAMIESVEKYGGFYIGRYELGYDDGVVCKPNVLALSSNDSSAATNYGNPSRCNWYGLYKSCKELSTSKMQAGMVWGCQIDAIKKYLGAEANDTSKILQEGRKKTGQYNDEVKKIHDLRGNMNEWTMMASREGGRCTFGGNYADPSISTESWVSVSAFRGYLGTRPYLFFK